HRGGAHRVRQPLGGGYHVVVPGRTQPARGAVSRPPVSHQTTLPPMRRRGPASPGCSHMARWPRFCNQACSAACSSSLSSLLSHPTIACSCLLGEPRQALMKVLCTFAEGRGGRASRHAMTGGI